jgi:DNA-binding IclR family transcriptional regulator
MRQEKVQAIESAFARLAADPSGGRITASRLAKEAEVSRSTIYRSVEVLQRIRDLDDGHITALETQVGELKRRETKHLRRLWAENKYMAKRIQFIARELNELRREIKQINGSP